MGPGIEKNIGITGGAKKSGAPKKPANAKIPPLNLGAGDDDGQKNKTRRHLSDGNPRHNPPKTQPLERKKPTEQISDEDASDKENSSGEDESKLEHSPSKNVMDFIKRTVFGQQPDKLEQKGLFKLFIGSSKMLMRPVGVDLGDVLEQKVDVSKFRKLITQQKIDNRLQSLIGKNKPLRKFLELYWDHLDLFVGDQATFIHNNNTETKQKLQAIKDFNEPRTVVAKSIFGSLDAFNREHTSLKRQVYETLRSALELYTPTAGSEVMEQIKKDVKHSVLVSNIIYVIAAVMRFYLDLKLEGMSERREVLNKVFDEASECLTKLETDGFFKIKGGRVKGEDDFQMIKSIIVQSWMLTYQKRMRQMASQKAAHMKHENEDAKLKFIEEEIKKYEKALPLENWIKSIRMTTKVGFTLQMFKEMSEQLTESSAKSAEMLFSPEIAASLSDGYAELLTSHLNVTATNGTFFSSYVPLSLGAVGTRTDAVFRGFNTIVSKAEAQKIEEFMTSTDLAAVVAKLADGGLSSSEEFMTVIEFDDQGNAIPASHDTRQNMAADVQNKLRYKINEGFKGDVVDDGLSKVMEAVSNAMLANSGMIKSNVRRHVLNVIETVLAATISYVLDHYTKELYDDPLVRALMSAHMKRLIEGFFSDAINKYMKYIDAKLDVYKVIDAQYKKQVQALVGQYHIIPSAKDSSDVTVSQETKQIFRIMARTMKMAAWYYKEKMKPQNDNEDQEESVCDIKDQDAVVFVQNMSPQDLAAVQKIIFSLLASHLSNKDEPMPILTRQGMKDISESMGQTLADAMFTSRHLVEVKDLSTLKITLSKALKDFMSEIATNDHEIQPSGARSQRTGSGSPGRMPEGSHSSSLDASDSILRNGEGKVLLANTVRQFSSVGLVPMPLSAKHKSELGHTASVANDVMNSGSQNLSKPTAPLAKGRSMLFSGKNLIQKDSEPQNKGAAL